MHNKLAILGFRGIGKSTVSRILAKSMKIPLYAIDAEIEKKEGKSIATIVEENGWNYFRDRELDHINMQSEREKVILDCGGGILEGHDGEYSEEKGEMLKKNFFCVYLFLPDEKLLTRLKYLQQKSSRPPLAGDTEKILKKRKPWFEKIAHVQINTDGLTAGQTVSRIMKELVKNNA